jgi:hypothetical protein
MAINISGTAGVTPTQWTTAGRPANPNLGQSGWNTTIGGLEFYIVGLSLGHIFSDFPSQSASTPPPPIGLGHNDAGSVVRLALFL